MAVQFHFDLADARDFVEAQLRKNAELDNSYLTIEDHKWYMEQLIQLEQAQALQRIASALEGFEAR